MASAVCGVLEYGEVLNYFFSSKPPELGLPIVKDTVNSRKT